MQSAALTPKWEFSTTRSEAVHAPGAACAHSFGVSPHYCTYVHAPEVIATLRPANTPDEQLVVSYLAACGLWWHLQERELAAVERSLDAALPLSVEQDLLARQRLDRCIMLAQTMQEASALLQRHIVAPAPYIAVGFRVVGALATIQTARDQTAVTRRLHAHLRPVGAGSPALRSRMLDFVALAGQVRLAVLRLLASLHDLARPPVSLDTLLPEALLSWSAMTLERHHPQAVRDPDMTDPLVFIVAHQLFEVWFPATIRALEEATSYLTKVPPEPLAALPLVERAADLVRLWHRMIHLPQTMSAPDYIAFRAQLEGGSGAESEQFRQVEIRAGLRSVDYWQRLDRLQLLTPYLSALWQQPSLNEAILALLMRRGVLTPDAPEQQAQQLAAILLPTAVAHPHADVAMLCRAALMLDEQLALWRQHHRQMVRAMIGSKPSIGIGEVVNQELVSADPQAQVVGGLPYLETTTSYQLFPLLHQALDALQENWQAVASTTRKAEIAC